MAEVPEIPVIKIQKDYQSPPNVESEVPETHEIREFDEKNNNSEITGEEGNQSNSSEVLNEDANTSSEIKITGADFTLSPVITVTKKESTLTKGDMKLQKVTVTEDIAVSYRHLFKKEVTPGKTVVTTMQKLEYKY